MPTSRMTAAEFAAARNRLGWTLVDAAVAYNVTPNVVEAFEAGSLKVPKSIARDIHLRSVLHERESIIAASGLQECPVAVDRARALEEDNGRARIDGSQAFLAHAKTCKLCCDRRDYLDRHAPPLPDLSVGLLFRFTAAANILLDRLPAPLRPPEAKAGEGRRIGFFIGAALSAFATGIVLLFTIARVVHLGWGVWWQGLAFLGVIIPTYFVGFYVAGWIWDALRPIHDRFLGYVLRFGLAGIAIYGAIAVAMPLMEDKPMSLDESLGFLGNVGGLWALIGVGVWACERLRSTLAKR